MLSPKMLRIRKPALVTAFHSSSFCLLVYGQVRLTPDFQIHGDYDDKHFLRIILAKSGVLRV